MIGEKGNGFFIFLMRDYEREDFFIHTMVVESKKVLLLNHWETYKASVFNREAVRL